MPRSLADATPAQVTASHGPGIEPRRRFGNEALDASFNRRRFLFCRWMKLQLHF